MDVLAVRQAFAYAKQHAVTQGARPHFPARLLSPSPLACCIRRLSYWRPRVGRPLPHAVTANFWQLPAATLPYSV
jgi:hypothetical protein